MKQLEGKTALVAGGGRNNGKAIALAFAREGADLILIAREKKESLDEVAHECEKLGVKVLPLLCDVSENDQVERMVKQGLGHYGKIDVLMCCAGRRAHQDFWQISVEEWHKTFAVNLHSAFYLAKAVAPSMMERKTGSIVALGGMASVTSQPQRAHVIASKHGLFGLIKAMAYELGPHNVRANLIALMTIENVRANPEWYPEGGAAYSEEALAAIPMRRAGKNAEVANVAVFLASDQSSYVTGDRILCAGGKYM
jgi:NAD(P)-dependent dehydrogenase (short-subunit alcohol dehydrogenase family)